MIEIIIQKKHEKNENNVEADKRCKQIFKICNKYNNLSHEDKKLEKYKKIPIIVYVLYFD